MASTLILCDQKEDLYREWSKCFLSYRNVQIRRENIFQIPCQAMVSPANSYGTMRGGLDYYISIFFDQNTPAICRELSVDIQTVLNHNDLTTVFRSKLDWTLERKVKERLRKEKNGYLPVGEAILVETDCTNIPFLIVAPTMEIPEKIAKSGQVYRAMKAIIEIVEKKGLGSVVVPGLGTGTGGLPTTECAQQMEQAFAEAYGRK